MRAPQQLRITLQTANHLSDLADAIDTASAGNPLARRALRSLGYSDDPVEQANEIGAKLAAGKFGELGLSRKMAIDFLEHHAATLTLRHGPQGAENIFRFVDARNEPVIHRAIARAALLQRRPPSAGSAGTPSVGGLPARGNGMLGTGISPAAAGEPAGGREVFGDGRAEIDRGTRASGRPVPGMAGRRPEGAGGGVRPDVPEQAGFFDAGTERQSPVDAQRGADRLLGDQLAAQLKSGLAAKPTKLKPAQNRGLFSDEGPEPGDLFGQMSRTMHGGVPLDVVGAIFKADLKEMLALKQKRDESLAALEKAKETPEEKRFGQKVIAYFTGERDMWSARVNQAMARLRKLVPDPIEQEALSPMRDFKADD